MGIREGEMMSLKARSRRGLMGRQLDESIRSSRRAMVASASELRQRSPTPRISRTATYRILFALADGRRSGCAVDAAVLGVVAEG